MKSYVTILTMLALTGCGSVSKKEQALNKCLLHAEDNLKSPISDSHYHNYIGLCMGAEGYKRKMDKTCNYKSNPLIDATCFK